MSGKVEDFVSSSLVTSFSSLNVRLCWVFKVFQCLPVIVNDHANLRKGHTGIGHTLEDSSHVLLLLIAEDESVED